MGDHGWSFADEREFIRMGRAEGVKDTRQSFATALNELRTTGKSADYLEALDDVAIFLRLKRTEVVTYSA